MGYHNSEKDIIKAQKWLASLGSKIKINGKMTIGMSTALYSFQRKNQLPVTGELDNVTWKALKKQNCFWKKLMRKFCGHKK